MKKIEENKAILLGDNCQYLVLKKVEHEKELYLICLNITTDPKFSLIKVKNNKAYFIKDEETISAVLNTLKEDREYMAKLETSLNEMLKKSEPKKPTSTKSSSKQTKLVTKTAKKKN